MPETSTHTLRWFDWIGSLLLISCLALVVLGISRMQSNAEDVMQWLPDHSSEREIYRKFEEHFRSDDFLIVTWDGCRDDDPRLAQLVAGLRRAQQSGGLIQSVQTGPEMATRLEQEIRLAPERARNRLAGWLFGIADRELTCLLVELTLAGTQDRPGVLEAVWREVDATPGLNRQELILAGYPYLATYLDDQVNASFARLLLPSFILATLVSLLCLRDVRLALILFVTSGVAAAISLAFVPLCGSKFGGLTSIIPTLAFVLTNSGGLHLIRYSLDRIGNPWRLLQVAWQPCLISTSTTAIGMLSLLRSEFPAIRDFGFFCAAGVGFSFVFQMVVIPWLLTRFGQTGLRRMSTRTGENFFWLTYLQRVQRHRWPINAGGAMLLTMAIVGLGHLQARVEVEGLFADNSTVIRSLRQLESRLGPLDQIELMLEFDDCPSAEFSRRVDFVRAAQLKLIEETDFELAHSLVNYLPARPRPRRSGRSLAEQTLYQRLLSEQRNNLANSSYLDVSGDREIWRISLRVPFTSAVDFESLRTQVQETTKQLESEYRHFDPTLAFPEWIYTGKTYLYHAAQKELLSDLFLNFCLAFAIITPLMIFVLRSVMMGTIAMIPNIMPMAIVFGGMGFLGLTVDIAIAMTASVALGIAVDDTAHFLIRFREFGGRLGKGSLAMDQTITQCGPAMLYTTLMSGSGIFVSYFSNLQVVSRFAATLTLLLLVALIADVLLLPAILFLFMRRPDKALASHDRGPPDRDRDD